MSAVKLKRQIKLGHKVRDIITGYEGITFQELLLMSGTLQLAVCPPATEQQKNAGEFPPGMNIDIHSLEYVDEGIIDRVIPPPAEALAAVKLGEKVKDEVTGLEGMVITRTIFANGCVYFSVQGPAVKGVVPEPMFLDWKRLKVIGDGISKKVRNEPPSEPTKVPGGPSTRAQRM